MSAISRARRLLDCHFHWYPQEVEEGLNRARGTSVHHSPEWYDLDAQLERMDALGCQVDVISSTGPFTGCSRTSTPTSPAPLLVCTTRPWPKGNAATLAGFGVRASSRCWRPTRRWRQSTTRSRR